MVAAVDLTPEMDAKKKTTPWRWVRREYSKRRWALIGALALTALILGTIGLGQIEVGTSSNTDQFIPLPDRLYYLVGLFRLSSPVSRFPLPVTLEVARWLAPLTLLLAGLGAITTIFGEQVGQLRVYLWYRNHVVVCGAGRVGMRLTGTFRNRNRKVVVIDHDPLESDVEECRELGVPVIKGDAADPVVLRRAKVHKAEYLIAVSGDDGINAQIALIADTDGRRSRTLSCYVNVSDGELSVLLDQAATFERTTENLQYRFFNIFQEGSRALIRRYPDTVKTKAGSPPCLLVVGGGPISVNLVIDAAHRWQIENGPDDPHLQVVLVDAEADSRVDGINERRSSLRRTCDLSAREVDPWSSDANPFVFLKEKDCPRPTMAILCPIDDAQGLTASMKLRRALPNDVPIIVCTTGRKDTGPLLDLASVGVLRNVHGFPVLDEVCQAWVELMLDGPAMNEDLARAVHARYVRHRLAEESGGAGDPSMEPWDSLSEDLRESNRQQALDYKRKLNLLKLTYVLAPDGQSPPYEFTEAQIEKLAMMEHDRWVAERLKGGWAYSSAKDVKSKTHPDLICWDDLDEATKDYDRRAMEDFPQVLSDEGFVIVPADANSGTSKQNPESLIPNSWLCPLCNKPAASVVP